MNLRYLFVVAAIALHGCAGGPNPASPPDMVRMDAPGDYTHAASGLVFPQEIGDIRRVSMFRRNSDPRQVTVGYSGGPPDCLSAITMFVNPASGSIDDAYAHAAAEVRQAYANAQLQREQTHPTNASRFGEFTVGDRTLQLMVQERKPGWMLTSRIMYPSACAGIPFALGGFFTQWDARQGPR